MYRESERREESEMSRKRETNLLALLACSSAASSNTHVGLKSYIFFRFPLSMFDVYVV